MACGITDYQSDCIIFCLFTVQCIATKIAYKDCLRYTSRAHRTHTHICTNPCKSSPSSHGDAELALTGFLQKTGQMVHTKLRCIQTPLSNSNGATRTLPTAPGESVGPRSTCFTPPTCPDETDGVRPKEVRVGWKTGKGRHQVSTVYTSPPRKSGSDHLRMRGDCPLEQNRWKVPRSCSAFFSDV